MKISPENKNYLVYIAKYLGVALIAGSVVHMGTLENGIMRYVVLLVIGVVLMMFGNITEAKQMGTRINAKFLLVITSLGFLSGGLQHYLDDPVFAGSLLSIGVIVTYVTFFLRDKVSVKKKDVYIVICIALSIFTLSVFIANTYTPSGHSTTEDHQ